jgi:hypothetical protein
MATWAQISAGWALWGKHPGSDSDYSVLSSSTEPLSPPEFASVLAHFAPGTPPAEPNLPSSLPWVIISRVGIEERPYLGMAIQESTSEVDSTGRPITQTSYFCVPYAELADGPVSYASLYQELSKVQLPQASHDLIQLDVAGLEPAALADDIIGEFGEPSVTAAAALLLCGPVSIVGSEGSTVSDRLRYLDAVAALLPYGYRADLTAATWSDSGARHQIRLAFAAKAREDAGVVRWRATSAGEPGGDPGDAYAALLQQIRARRSGQGDRDSRDQLASLISFFARDAAPGLFERPQRAVTTLRDFDLPFIAADAVLAGKAQPADVRAVFTRSRITDLPPDRRRALLAALISFGDPQDIPAIRTWWDVVVAGDCAAMLPALVHTCRRLLWTPTPGLTIKEYLALADNYGLLDDLLAELIVLPDSRAELSGGLSAAAQLLADWVLSTPDAGFPRTQQAMANNQILAGELLTQLAGTEPGTRTALAWLEPALGDFLRPFLVVLGAAPGAVDPAQIAHLAHYDVTCVRALLQAASYGGRLHLVLPGFTTWLALGAVDQQAPAGMSRYWYELAWSLTGGDAFSRAWLDLALLVSANQPRFLLAAMDWPGHAQYNENLAGAWPELVGNTGQPVEELLTSTFIGYLAGTSWTSDAMLVDTVVNLASLLTSDGRRTRLQTAIVESLLAAPEAAHRDSARAWLAQVLPSHRDLGGDVLLSLRGPHHPDVTEADLADLCARGFRDGLDPADICRALADSGAIRSGSSAINFAEHLWVAVDALSAREQRALDGLRLFIGWLADGAFGSRVAEEFRHQAIQSAGPEIYFRLNMLYIAATAGQPDSLPELSEADIAQLEWIPKSVDKIVKDAKKRSKQQRARGGRHGRGEADTFDGRDGKDGRDGSEPWREPDQDPAGQF